MTNFEKAYDKAHKNSSLKNWWKKNRLTVLRIVLFPLYLAELLEAKIQKYNAKKNEWTDQRAKDFFDKYLPRFCEKTDAGFRFFNNGIGFACNKTIRRSSDRYFARTYKYKLFAYLTRIYEIEGYTKQLLLDGTHGCDCIEIKWIKEED